MGGGGWNGALALSCLVATGCLGTWREYIVTTEDVALVTAPAPPLADEPPPEPGGQVTSVGVSIGPALGWAEEDPGWTDVGHVLPVVQGAAHWAWRPAHPIEIGFGAQGSTFGLSEPTMVWLQEEPLEGKATLELGPTVRVMGTLDTGTTLGLVAESRALWAQVSRWRTVVTVMEQDDGSWYDDSYYVESRERTHHEDSPWLFRQVVGLWADVPLEDRWHVSGGASLQSQPVFEAHYEQREQCYGGDDCHPPASLTPSCHAGIIAPWLGVAVPLRERLLQATVFGAFNPDQVSCPYPTTAGLELELVRQHGGG